MSSVSSSKIDNLMYWWGVKIHRFPWLIIILTILFGSASLYYTVNNLGINTNSAEMLSPDLPFQKNTQRIEEEFPQDSRVIILVIDTLTPEETSQTAVTVAEKLKQQSKNFSSVYIPTENDFFHQQALLFLDLEKLEQLAEKLAKTQPFIGYLAQNYHLQGLFDIISKALKSEDDSLPTDLDPLLTAINDAITHQLNNQPYHLSWQNLIAANELNPKRSIVIAKPILNFDEVMAAENALSAARAVIDQVMQDNPGVKIRITGETALEHEELESVSEGAIFSGVASFFLVCLSLWLCLRSIKLMIATLIVLILGLILTAGFATFSVGHLNLISIAFAVLYIGLGVDYAIHICLHYREHREQGENDLEAISQSLKTVGFPILLCAITTSMGFLAFIPTDYSGVSEFGIISAGGMYIGFFVSVTVLPALINVFSIKNVKPVASSFSLGSLATVPFRYSTPIRILTLLTAILASTLLTQLVFDSNPINLRDPNSESVSTIKELLKSQSDSPFALLALAPNREDAKKMAHQLEQLPSVHEAIILDNLVAENQQEKLEVIEELDLILGNQLNSFKPVLDTTDPKQALLNFNSNIAEALEKETTHAPRATLELLYNNIRHILLLSNSNTNDEPYKLLEKNILGLLPYTMQRLQTSLTAQPYQLEEIPETIRTRWLSPNGQYKIHITPEYDQNKIENLKQFVTEVTTVAPSASGLPVADQASGTAITEAFIQAFIGAVVAIFVLLLIILRDFKNTLLVVGTLLLAALLTGAVNVLLNNPFNFANVIALPLLMGMGVDSSIHIMQRLKSGLSSKKEILQSGTARGVFFSSITTLCSFSSLAFTPHVGTSSMGLLLAVGIFFTLACTLIVLPAFYSKDS